jgi:hypothetical protein
MDVLNSKYNNLTIFGREIFCGAKCKAKKEEDAQMQEYLSSLSTSESSLLIPIVAGVAIIGSIGLVGYFIMKK